MATYCEDCEAPLGSPFHDMECVWPAEEALGLLGLNEDDDPALIMGG